jgi:hypothetical protein
MTKKDRVAAPEAPWWASELASYWATGAAGKDTQRAAAAALRTIGDLHHLAQGVADSDDDDCSQSLRQLATVTLQACGLDLSHIDSGLYGKVPIQMLADLMAGLRHHFKPGAEVDVVRVITGMLIASLNQVPLRVREAALTEMLGLLATTVDCDKEHPDDG